MNRVYLVLLVFISLVVNIIAQNHIRFNHLTIEDGLSQSAVTCIFQDKNGFMWFGTQDGLNRYDGYSFKIFRNNPRDPSTLSDNFIFSIYEDRNGILYIETLGGTFNKYNPLTESFAIVTKDSIDLSSAKFNSVGAMFIESSGTIWTGGLSKEIGLTHENKITGEISHFKHNPSDPSTLSNDKVYSVFKDHSGNVWVGTYNGLDKLDEKSGKFYHYKNDPNNSNSLADNWVWPIYEDKRGILWIGTVKSGISAYNPKTNIFVNYKNDPNDPESLNDNFIFSIYEDRSGVIWIGTNEGGVNYFYPPTQVFNFFAREPGINNTLSDNSVKSLYVDKSGNYWIGTLNGGLDKFNFKERKFKNFSNSPSNPNSLISNAVQTIYEDKSGILWLGTFSDGLDAFDPVNNNFTHYTHNPSNPNSITDNRIYALLEDGKGIIWIGTYGGGLNSLDRKTGKINSYTYNEKDTNSISSNSIRSIIEDKFGRLWIGTYGGGVNIFDPARKTFKRIQNNPDDSTSLPADDVFRVFQDSKDNIWIGTTKGLSKYLVKSNSFRNYSFEDGLPNDMIYAILEDDKGNLWLSTNNGLSKFNPDEETFKNYYQQDGLQSSEFNLNAYAKDNKTGYLLFGGPNGFNVFHPDSVKDNLFKPPIVLTKYLRYNTDDEEGKPIVEKGISELDSILLTFKDNIVTFDFAALSYYNSNENQYRYKLEGFNENWIQLGNNHSVTFTNLSSGDYKLRVIGSNNDGVWNEEGASLFIDVLPPWWRTNIAYAVYAISFISFLYGVRRFEIKRREQKAKLRENELRLKATEAEKRAIQIENDRKTKELEEARQLQLSMLPRELPKLPNLEIAAFMRTATEVGGDYYDFIVQENGVLNVGFGDATGHGLQAGTMVTLMKGFFTSDAAKLEPQDFMNHCSSMIKEIKLGRILMSFSLLRFDNSKLLITSAGMPPVYHYIKEKKETQEILIQGMPLGAMRKFSYKLVETELKSGDTLLLLTDGLPEQTNPKEEMFDYPRVKKHFNEIADGSPDEIINSLIKTADNWMNGQVQADDISFIVIKVN